MHQSSSRLCEFEQEYFIVILFRRMLILMRLVLSNRIHEDQGGQEGRPGCSQGCKCSARCRRNQSRSDILTPFAPQIHGRKKIKARYSTTFHHPKTLKLSRAPKYPRKSIPHEPRLDEHKVIVHPLNSEGKIPYTSYLGCSSLLTPK